MHEDKTGAFLLALLHHTHTQAQIDLYAGLFVPLCGGYRYAPLHCVRQQPGQPYGMKGGHGYFEIALDSTLHAEDTGVSEVPADDSSPVPVGQDLAEIAALLHQCILEVYGQDISVEALADSFYYTYRLRRLFTSRHGVRRAFYWVLELFFGGRGFITGHVSPAHLKLNLPEDWTDPATGQERHGGAFALLKDAQHRCRAVYDGRPWPLDGQAGRGNSGKDPWQHELHHRYRNRAKQKPTSAGCGTGRRNRLTSPSPTFEDRLLQHERN